MFSIRNKSFNRLICLLILEEAIPFISRLYDFLIFITLSSIFFESRDTLEFIKVKKTSTITSLESPGCNNPIDKHNFLTNSLLSRLYGFSYFLKVISARGISLETLLILIFLYRLFYIL